MLSSAIQQAQALLVYGVPQTEEEARTLKRQGYNPNDTLVSVLREYVLTGQFPPFPSASTLNQ